MKLYYEFKKIILSKDFWIIAGIFLIMNVGLILFETNTSSDMRVRHDTKYNEIMDTLDSLSVDRKIDYLNDEIEEISKVNEIEEMLNSGSSINDLSKQDRTLYFRYNDRLKNISLANYKVLLLSTKTEIENNYSYSDYVISVKEGINNIKKDPIWKTYSNHKKDSFDKMYMAYDNLEKITITENRKLTLDVIASNKTIDIMMVAFVILVVSYVFQSDEKTKMSDIISASKVGYKRISFLKLITSIIIVLLFTFIFYLLFILTSSFRYGFVDLNSSIQSYSTFSTSPYPFTVFQYYIFLISYKVFVYSLIVLIAAIFYRMFSNRRVGIALFCIILVISAILYNVISENSYLYLVKYLNIFGLLQFSEMIKMFIFIEANLLSTLWLNISLLITVLGIIICLPIYLKLITKRRNFKSSFNFSQRLRFYKPKSVSLFFHELYKIMFLNKSFLVLLMGLFLITTINIQENNTNVYKLEKLTIELIEEYGGIKSEDTNKFIAKTSKKYSKQKNLVEDAYSKFNNNKITEKEYNLIVQEYQEQHIERTAFERFKELYESSEEYVIYKKPYDIIFSQYSAKNEIFISLVCIMLLIIILSDIYVIDKVYDEDQIYITTVNGRSVRRNNKIMNSILLVAFLFIASFVIQFLIVQYKYGFESLNAPMTSVLDMEINSEGFIAYPYLQSISLKAYILLINFIRIIGLLFVAVTCILISLLSRNRISAVLVSAVVFFVPSLLHLIGLTFAKYFSVFDVISGNVFVRQIYLYPKLVLFMLLIIVNYYTILKLTEE